MKSIFNFSEIYLMEHIWQCYHEYWSALD